MKKSKKKMLYWLIPTIIGVSLLAFILIGSFKYKNTFFNNTYIGNTYVGGKSIAEATKIYESHNKYLTLITSDNKNIELPLKEIDYVANYRENINSVKKSQNPVLWFLNLTGKKEYTPEIKATFNKEVLDKNLENLDIVTSQNIIASQNAHLTFENGKAVIKKEVYGNKLDLEKFKESVANNLKDGNTTINLKEENLYEMPTVLSNSPSLKTALNKVESLNNAVITINLHKASEELTPEKYIAWIETDEKGDLTLNDALMNEYFEELSRTYNTYRTKRNFETTGRGVITVGGGANDTYGFQIDVEKTKKAVKESILKGKSDVIDVYWSVSAKDRNKPNGDIGNTYVEIDLTRQHMWYYINGKLLLDTPIRSGTENTRQNTPTPTGLYRILGKSTDKYFTDFQPVFHSDYWMPFDLRGDGIHDAPWYKTFGGELYKDSGSHGCINTPLEKVKLMYDNITLGTPVIVYR